MNIGIVGFGREGHVAYEYWNSEGVTFYIYDKNESLEIPTFSIPRLGEGYKEFLQADDSILDLIVRSPGVVLWDMQEKIHTPITTITREFFDRCPCSIIGVTGTKGKGTTATLIYQMLQHAGKDVHLVGNIGTPALSVLSALKADSIVVYELSSFQLFDLHKSPSTAVCLLVTEDHLDWHKDLRHYQVSKGNIFSHQHSADTAVWNTDNSISTNLHTYSPAKNKISFGSTGVVHIIDSSIWYENEKVCGVQDVALLGAYNLQNICAAIATLWNTIPKESILYVLHTFSGLPYHNENKGTFGSITFVNDSFSVNPTSTSVAIESMRTPTTLLIGGVDRGLDLTPFVHALQSSSWITNIICYGEEAVRISKALTEASITHIILIDTFESIFARAIALTQKNSTVLFSPGAPSFDMFNDYIARGKAFDTLVEKYKENLL